VGDFSWLEGVLQDISSGLVMQHTEFQMDETATISTIYASKCTPVIDF